MTATPVRFPPSQTSDSYSVDQVPDQLQMVPATGQ